MNDASPPLKQLNRTFIGSVLFIDIVGYSRRTVPDQLEMKELFNSLLSDAIQHVGSSERIMVDTGDGAGIAFLGDPEDALFAALSLRDAVAAGRAATVGEPGFVRMGINLGPLKIVRDINDHTNMIGDGVNDAERVMTFAEPGQVMVSHSYYDIISRFSRDYAQLFVYEGTRHDKHVREHEVYRFGPLGENENLAEKLRDRSRARNTAAAEAILAAPTSAAAKAAHADAGAHPKRISDTIKRASLVAGAIGALTLVGAVWSWTRSEPEPKADTVASLAASPASALAGEKDPIAELAASAHATSASVSTSVSDSMAAEVKPAASAPVKPAEVRVAKAAEASSPKNPASTPAGSEASTSASVKASENASTPVKAGSIKLAIQPWGEIYIDGSKRGISPPVKSINLPPGKHRIEVRNGEFAPYKETVEVKSGVETTVQYVF